VEWKGVEGEGVMEWQGELEEIMEGEEGGMELGGNGRGEKWKGREGEKFDVCMW
jgi:hypothetical protein